jgi:hypothetical protein
VKLKSESIRVATSQELNHAYTQMQQKVNDVVEYFRRKTPTVAPLRSEIKDGKLYLLIGTSQYECTYYPPEPHDTYDEDDDYDLDDPEDQKRAQRYQGPRNWGVESTRHNPRSSKGGKGSTTIVYQESTYSLPHRIAENLYYDLMMRGEQIDVSDFNL